MGALSMGALSMGEGQDGGESVPTILLIMSVSF